MSYLCVLASSVAAPVCRVTCVFFISSPTLPLGRHDSKRAVCHVPKESCRGRNDEAKEESRNPQVGVKQSNIMAIFFCVFCFWSHTNFRLTGFWLAALCPSLRRIDVSPSAFKRHSDLFEDMEETSYKVTSPFWSSTYLKTRKFHDPKQQYSALCFSFKGCIF